MIEKVVRDLLLQTMAGDEPPIGRPIVGGAVRRARTVRRRRLAAGITAAAAIVSALSFGVPAAVGALAPAAPVKHHDFPALGGGTAVKPHANKAHMQAVHRGTVASFVRPRLPATWPDANPVPITNQSLGQLLIDDLPYGAQISQIEANDNFVGGAPQAYRSAYVWSNRVTTPSGSGKVEVSMITAGPKPFDFGCAGMGSVPCRQYSLPDGIEVVEMFEGMPSASVFRPGVAEISVSESNAAKITFSPTTKDNPLTMRQMLKIALDSRWQFTFSQAFVQAASGLYVAPLNTSGD